MASLVGFLQRPRIMPSNWKSRAFLEAGPWLPLEVAAPLVHQLEALAARAKAQEPLPAALELRIKIELADIDHLLNLGESDLFVPADRWKAALRDVRFLVKLLARRQ